MKVLKDSLNVKKWLLCGSVPAAVLNFFLLTHSHISVTQQQVDSVNRELAAAALAPAGCKPSPCRLDDSLTTHICHVLTCLFSASVPSWPCRQDASLLCELCDTRRTSSIRFSICEHRRDHSGNVSRVKLQVSQWNRKERGPTWCATADVALILHAFFFYFPLLLDVKGPHGPKELLAQVPQFNPFEGKSSGNGQISDKHFHLILSNSLVVSPNSPPPSTLRDGPHLDRLTSRLHSSD